MNVACRHTAVGNQFAIPCLTRLLGVAIVVIGGHESFVAPPYVHAAPVHGIVQWARVHGVEHSIAVGSTGHGNVNAGAIRFRQKIGDGQQRTCGHGFSQNLRIGIYNGGAFCHMLFLHCSFIVSENRFSASN